ncbi:MAG: DUF3450 domain-containing protein [Gammaproteobacteria bacterium]|nr:DUF3450 domain-containing protein [Gammaproteobacteria bacterium]MBU1653706.1 DUF3450 domain-containing protein [Gammaproteobacteria bacterium]MBU1962759.1 DUF3450 domain-containing protein [Gammaproteobacteria bacterium]
MRERVAKWAIWMMAALSVFGLMGAVRAAEGQAAALAVEYRMQQARLEQLSLRKQQLASQLDGQARELASLEQRLALVPSEAQVLALLRQMVETLEAFIRADLPFHQKERLEQAAGLGAVLDRPDLAASEKLSRVMKAYQGELEYGRTIEAYDGELETAGGGGEAKRLVTFLRYGRVALVYQTFDGGETALWNKGQGGWQPLSGRFAAEVKQGIRIALKRLPPDLLILPVQGVAQ